MNTLIQREIFEYYEETLIIYSIEKHKLKSKFRYNKIVCVAKSSIHAVKYCQHENVHSELCYF